MGVAEGERDGDAIYLFVLEEVLLKKYLPERREVMILGGSGEMREFTIRDKHTRTHNGWERKKQSTCESENSFASITLT